MSTKDTDKRMKRQTIDWEKTFTKYTFDKGLLIRLGAVAHACNPSSLGC